MKNGYTWTKISLNKKKSTVFHNNKNWNESNKIYSTKTYSIKNFCSTCKNRNKRWCHIGTKPKNERQTWFSYTTKHWQKHRWLLTFFLKKNQCKQINCAILKQTKEKSKNYCCILKSNTQIRKSIVFSDEKNIQNKNQKINGVSIDNIHKMEKIDGAIWKNRWSS